MQPISYVDVLPQLLSLGQHTESALPPDLLFSWRRAGLEGEKRPRRCVEGAEAEMLSFTCLT